MYGNDFFFEVYKVQSAPLPSTSFSRRTPLQILYLHIVFFIYYMLIFFFFFFWQHYWIFKISNNIHVFSHCAYLVFFFFLIRYLIKCAFFFLLCHPYSVQYTYNVYPFRVVLSRHTDIYTYKSVRRAIDLHYRHIGFLLWLTWIITIYY